MLGYDHATMGAMAGIATCPTHHSWEYQVAWVATWTAASLWPDFDQPGSSAGRSFGVLSNSAARAIGFFAGGHRWGTHDVVLAPLALYFVVLPATLATVWGRMVVVALVVALALHAMLPRHTLSRLAEALLAAAAAWWLVRIGFDQTLPLRSILTAGVLVHCLGDLPTSEGLPVPVVWLASRKARVVLPLFHVGSWVEKSVVAPALSLLLALVAVQRFAPATTTIHLLPGHLPWALPI